MAGRAAWQGPPADQIVAWSIVQAGHAVGRTFSGALAEVGLTPVQFGVLLQLDQRPGLSNAALARTVLVTPQSMSGLMAGLVADGLVERDASSGPGRAVTAHLTTAGRRRLRRCEAVVAAVEVSLGLDPAEAAVLNAALHRVIDGS